VLLGRPLEALKTKGNRSGKKREVQRAHHNEKRGQRQLGTASFAWLTKIFPGGGSLRKNEWSQGKRKREWGRGSARVHAGLST